MIIKHYLRYQKIHIIVRLLSLFGKALVKYGLMTIPGIKIKINFNV